MPQIRYPRNLNAFDVAPAVAFTPYNTSGEVSTPAAPPIVLYMPPGFAVQDGADFAEFNMGVIGNQIAKQITDTGLDSEDIISLVSGNGANMAGSVNSTFQHYMTARALSTATSRLGNIDGESIVSNRTGKILNPNNAIAFKNMAIRSFQFNFTLMPDSRDDARVIRRIESIFRRNMYPEGDEFILEYPCKWRISWEGTARNNYPGIFESYLTSLSVTNNTLSGLPMSDGAPAEKQISLTFQETRVLRKRDIDELNDGGADSSDAVTASGSRPPAPPQSTVS